MSYPAGQQVLIPYTTLLGGVVVNPWASGGAVLSLDLYATPARTGVPVASATAVQQTTSGALFTITTPAATGIYYAVTQWRTQAGAAVTVDADDTVTVQAGTGYLGASQIVDVATVKQALNIPTGLTVQDDLIAAYILMATDTCDWACGPTLPTQVTDTVYDVPESRSYAYQGSLWPRRRPVLAVQALTDVQTGATSALTLLPNGNVLVGGVNGSGPWTLTYTAGRDKVPPGLARGLVELIRFHWEAEQRGMRPGFGLQADGGGFYIQERIQAKLGLSLPNRVRELWAPFMRRDGFA